MKPSRISIVLLLVSAVVLFCIYRHSYSLTFDQHRQTWFARTDKELRHVQAAASNTGSERPIRTESGHVSKLVHHEQSDERAIQAPGTSWDPRALNLADLVPREDAYCTVAVDITFTDAQRAEHIFECRKAVARKQAEEACELLSYDPPHPPFARASLNIRRYASGHKGPTATATLHRGPGRLPIVPNSISIAVEAGADIVSKSIKRKGVWELSEVEAVLAALESANTTTATAATRPPVLVDIGANLGVFSFVAAALGYPVLAFEAMSRNVAAIHQTLCWNPELRERLTLFPYGLAEAEHACMVVSDIQNVADGHLVCSEEQLREYRGAATSRGVAHSVRLGDYLHGVKTDVVKIDVEGYEPQVLRGAGDVLDGVQYALSELSQDMPKKAGRSFSEVALEYLRGWTDRGFDIRFCDEDSGCFLGRRWSAEAATAEAQRRGICNVLLTRQKTPAALT